MKISILLPYKENFSPNYPGAVSLFVNDTLKLSQYKKNIKVFGNTSYKKKFSRNYKNIKLKKIFFGSQSENYMDEFIKHEKSNPSNIIEIHNRPHYLKYLINEGVKSKFVLYFHNDPLTMTGSKNLSERKYLVDICEKIIFNSLWSKKRFLENISAGSVNSEKLIVIFQSASKNKINLKNKKNYICYSNKSNDFIKKIEKFTKVKMIKLSGFNNSQLINIYKKTKIYLDFGYHPGKDRMPREAAIFNNCIITNKRGSAKNKYDIPINEKYKFEENYSSLSKIKTQILKIFKDYKNELKNFEPYKKKIINEKNSFIKDLKNIFKKKR